MHLPNLRRPLPGFLTWIRRPFPAPGRSSSRLDNPEAMSRDPEPLRRRLHQLPPRFKNVVERETVSWLLAHPWQWRYARADRVEPLSPDLCRFHIRIEFMVRSAHLQKAVTHVVE